MVYQSAPSIFTKWTLLPNFTIEFVVNPILRGFSVQYLEDHRIMKTGRPDGASPRGFPKAAGLGGSVVEIFDESTSGRSTWLVVGQGSGFQAVVIWYSDFIIQVAPFLGE